MRRILPTGGVVLAVLVIFVGFYFWCRSQFWFGLLDSSTPPKRADYFLYIYTILTFLTLLTVVVAGIAAYRQLAAAERNLRFQIYRDLLTMVDEFERERHRIEHEFPKDTTDFDFKSLPPEQCEKLERVCRSFDKLGMMVAKGVVPLSFLMDFHTRGLVIVWHRLRPFVQQLRDKRNQKGHFKQFQMLAIAAKMHRDANPEYAAEETFQFTEEDAREWTKWRQKFGANFWDAELGEMPKTTTG